VTLEFVDIDSNRLLWRDTSTAPAADPIALRDQIASRLRQGLFPLLGSTTSGTGAATRPKNPEAYDLYLRAKPLTSDPGPNDKGVTMLERSVGLDPDFAPAWSDLALRYYYQAAYGGGGDAVADQNAAAKQRRAKTALERPLAPDPSSIDATQTSIVFETEGSNLDQAWRHARDLVKLRPDSSLAHFAAAYVLRYAGLLEESARECDTALALDPHDRGLRSCAFAFTALGRYDRAREYLKLDAGSDWVKGREVSILIREGRREAAADAAGAFGFPHLATILRPSTPQAERDAAAKTIEARASSDRDPENNFWVATILASAGYDDAALRLLHRGVEMNYLFVTPLDTDPTLASVRKRPEFAAIREEAVRRQKEFLAHRGAGS